MLWYRLSSFKHKTIFLSHTSNVHNKTESVLQLSNATTMQSSIKSQPYSKNNKIYSHNTAILECDLCSDSFPNGKELKTHRSKCAKKERFFCDVCKIYVGRKSALDKHKRSKQHNLNLQNPPKGEEETFKYICLHCNERFPLQIDLTKHKKIHIEAKLLTETSRVERVDGRITYTCTICSKSTTNKAIHTEHLRVHTKEKPVKCDLCGSAFSSRSSLIRHMALHSDERPYKCNICSETYKHKRNLRKHLFIHTGQRPFKCQYCDKTFALRFTFNDHVRLWHTKETPYQCGECKKSFRTSYLLNFHRREEHNIDTKSTPKVKILNKKN